MAGQGSKVKLLIIREMGKILACAINIFPEGNFDDLMQILPDRH